MFILKISLADALTIVVVLLGLRSAMSKHGGKYSVIFQIVIVLVIIVLRFYEIK